MSKFLLDIEPDYDFIVVGISCHNKDYRISFELNKSLEIQLSKMPDHMGQINRTENIDVPFFKYCDDENRLNFALLGNRNYESVYLFPECKTWDYLLLLNGALDFYSIENLIENIKKIPIVLACKKLSIDEFKQKENLIIEW